MDEIREEKYYKESVKAYILVQKKSEEDVLEKKKLGRILEDDPWWKDLLNKDRRLIAKFIARNDSQLQKICKDFDIDVHYYYRRDNEGSGDFYVSEDSGNTLYHYTSLSVCLNILKGKTLYLMNSDYMNDIRERSYFRGITQAYFDTMINGRRISQFYSDYDKNYSKPAYLISFSKKGDDAAQWERYADEGYGVCIGFSEEELKNITKSIPYLRLEKVEYSKKFRDNALQNKLENFFNSGTRNYPRARNNLLNEYYTECISHKHASFDAEEEVRLITSTVYEKGISSELSRFESNGSMKETWKFEWDKFFSNDPSGFERLIKKIIIGPRAEYGCDLLEKHLKTMGYSNNIIVEQSDCPLRQMRG